MIWIALSLGFFGSLHCIGMCGPLAIMACQNQESAPHKSAFLYNAGRLLTYTTLGLLFGLIGQLLFIASIQKFVAILSGLILIAAFLMSVNIDTKIGQSAPGKFINKNIQRLFSFYTSRPGGKSVFIFGLLNGLLPCGLVYLALAGALASETISGAMLFMLFFGLGTVPSMVGLLSGFGLLKGGMRRKVTRILPMVSFVFGLFLIYRGVFVDMPLELDFWQAMKNPVLCH